MKDKNKQFIDSIGATPLGPDDMAGLRHPHITSREELNELEMANIIQGYMWINRVIKIERPSNRI